MDANEQIHIDLSDTQRTENTSSHKLGFEHLEQRITPLVVIAIIAILIGLLLPA